LRRPAGNWIRQSGGWQEAELSEDLTKEHDDFTVAQIYRMGTLLMDIASRVKHVQSCVFFNSNNDDPRATSPEVTVALISAAVTILKSEATVDAGSSFSRALSKLGIANKFRA
jgi:hypothetical protein